jgi:hypothetical protein
MQIKKEDLHPLLILAGHTELSYYKLSRLVFRLRGIVRVLKDIIKL